MILSSDASIRPAECISPDGERHLNVAFKGIYLPADATTTIVDTGRLVLSTSIGRREVALIGRTARPVPAKVIPRTASVVSKLHFDPDLAVSYWWYVGLLILSLLWPMPAT
jgi:hypothetical protein